MKLTKSYLRQIIKEELGASPGEPQQEPSVSEVFFKSGDNARVKMTLAGVEYSVVVSSGQSSVAYWKPTFEKVPDEIQQKLVNYLNQNLETIQPVTPKIRGKY